MDLLLTLVLSFPQLSVIVKILSVILKSLLVTVLSNIQLLTSIEVPYDLSVECGYSGVSGRCQ